MRRLEVEPGGQAYGDTCPRCGVPRRLIWGFVRDNGAPAAAYYVQWVDGQLAMSGGNIELILGRWGDDTDASDRYVVSMEFSVTTDGGRSIVTDPRSGGPDFSAIASSTLSRAEAARATSAHRSSEIFDELLLQDARLLEFRQQISGRTLP